MNLNFVTCWNFDAIKDISSTLECIHIHIYDTEARTYESLNKLLIPLEMSAGVKVIPKLKSKCNHVMLELANMHEFYLANENFTSRLGFLILLFSTEPDWSQVLAVAEQKWHSRRIYKVFYVTKEVTRFYHPFLVGDDHGKFGGLVDTKDYNINSIFRNLNGHPMRVYVFDSVFSTVETADLIARKVNKINGADAKVAYLLEKLLNFKMELQWPDDDFFG